MSSTPFYIYMFLFSFLIGGLIFLYMWITKKETSGGLFTGLCFSILTWILMFGYNDGNYYSLGNLRPDEIITVVRTESPLFVNVTIVTYKIKDDHYRATIRSDRQTPFEKRHYDVKIVDIKGNEFWRASNYDHFSDKNLQKVLETFNLTEQ